MKDYIIINQSDTVGVALKTLKKGEIITINNDTIQLKEDIMQGHKFSLVEIREKENIVKYGHVIGHASIDIKKGYQVHTHNMKTNLSDALSYEYQPVMPTLKQSETSYFMGYQRENGAVGVRNEIWLIPTVGCMNSVVKEIESLSKKYIKEGLEDIIAFNHPYGCSQMGDDQENTQLILADLIQHPNAGAVIVMGLGCENSNIEEIKRHLPSYNEERVKFLVAQEVEDEVEACLDLIKELVEISCKDQRQKVSVEKLKIGLKCGGSDGLSGITANPVVGVFSDLLVSKGGTTILTEVPEMFGAETILMNRCETVELFGKTVELINDFKEYFIQHKQTIYENPSPGNKEGGISTLEDKSLGCTQKSGTANIVGVLSYGEICDKAGLNLLSSPGNDLVASTALAASGCQIVLFTTGRGTPFASAVPTMKISSNTELYQKKEKWIDFNAGKAIEDSTIEETGMLLFEEVIAIASGKKVKSEMAGYHDLAIFKQGVTL